MVAVILLGFTDDKRVLVGARSVCVKVGVRVMVGASVCACV